MKRKGCQAPGLPYTRPGSVAAPTDARGQAGHCTTRPPPAHCPAREKRGGACSGLKLRRRDTGSAVHLQRLPCQEGACLTRQEEQRALDVIHLARSPQRYLHTAGRVRVFEEAPSVGLALVGVGSGPLSDPWRGPRLIVLTRILSSPNRLAARWRPIPAIAWVWNEAAALANLAAKGSSFLLGKAGDEVMFTTAAVNSGRSARLCFTCSKRSRHISR